MSHNRKTMNGFTLVEVLVIAPFIILIIAGFIALIITITGDVLNTKNSSDLIYTTEDALARIEQDVQRTTEFRQTSYTPTSPQGQSDNTTAFDTVSQASTYLILRSRATDKSPINDTRALIYTASGATCSTNPYTFDIVYFTKVTSGVTSLWRRIVFGSTTDAGTPCSGTTPWQQPTCSPGYTNAFCKADDTLLLSNVSTITLRYLNAAGTQINTTTPTAGTAVSNPNDAAGTTNASSISLSLSVGNTVAGRAGTYTGSLSAKKSPAPAVVSGGGGGVATFNYTGAVQTWTVPTGITSIQIECWGAQGGAGSSETGGYYGGLGSYAKGNTTVSAGQTINVYVGGQGGGQSTFGAAGYNGGGAGINSGSNFITGGGGGGSDVRINGTAVANKVINCGGGGGAGGYSPSYGGSGGVGGGGGGGNAGGNGGGYGTDDGVGGLGGNSSIGGGAGDNFYGTGETGNFLKGGNGASYGGGGGGGYAGGGGGSYTGGGGGSSYTGGVTAGTATAGVRTGNGQIIITY